MYARSVSSSLYIDPLCSIRPHEPFLNRQQAVGIDCQDKKSSVGQLYLIICSTIADLDFLRVFVFGASSLLAVLASFNNLILFFQSTLIVPQVSITWAYYFIVLSYVTSHVYKTKKNNTKTIKLSIKINPI